MMCRISSMYDHHRKIITLLVVSGSVEIIFVLVMKIYSDVTSVCESHLGSVIVMKHITKWYNLAMPDPAPGIHLCVKLPTKKILFATPITLLLVETLLFALSLLRGIDYYQSQTRISISTSQRCHSLPNVLFRDSILLPFLWVFWICQ